MRISKLAYLMEIGKGSTGYSVKLYTLGRFPTMYGDLLRINKTL